MGIHKTSSNEGPVKSGDRLRKQSEKNQAAKESRKKGAIRPDNHSDVSYKDKFVRSKPPAAAKSGVAPGVIYVSDFAPERPIVKQFEPLRNRLLLGLSDSRIDNAPLVVVSKGSRLIVGLEEIQKFHEGVVRTMRDLPGARRIAWQKGLKGFQISLFEDEVQAPLHLRDLDVAGRLGVSSPDLITRLLLPAFRRERAQVLRAYLAEKKAFASSFQGKGADLLAEMSVDEREKGLNGLLMDSLVSHTTELCRFLLEHGASPNAFDSETRFYALECCALYGAEDHEKLLLAFGADANNPKMKVWPKSPENLLAQAIGAEPPGGWSAE